MTLQLVSMQKVITYTRISVQVFLIILLYYALLFYPKILNEGFEKRLE